MKSKPRETGEAPTKRGGARKGAGRKPRETPREAITVRLEPQDAAKFKAICEAKGKSQAAQFSEWVKRAKF